MPTTRRQSVRLLKKCAGLLDCSDDMSDLTDLDDDDEQETALRSDHGSESNGDESDGSTYSYGKRKPAQKASKRTRISEVPKRPGTKAQQKKKDNRKSLSMLLDMPLDILFEILSHLLPADLLSLARTARNFRQLLMTKRAVSIWKKSRKRVTGDDAPDCPPDMSEPQWANLIWGGNACQECAAKPVLNVSFAIRRRVCTRCLKKHLVKKPDFHKKFPDYDEVIMDLITYTNVGGWAHGYESSTKYFWDDDIVAMGHKLGVYQKAVFMRQPNAKSKLDGFKKDSAKAVEEYLQCARKATGWFHSFSQQQVADANQIRHQRIEDMKTRLLNEGFDIRDIDDVFLYGRRNVVAKPLTDSSWKRSYPSLIKDLQRAKQMRLDEEFRPILTRRKASLVKVYQSFLAKQVPAEALYYPKAEALCEFPALKEILYRPAEADVTEGDFEKMVLNGELLASIQQWLQEDPRKAEFSQRLTSPNSPVHLVGGTTAKITDVNAASAVFRCLRAYCTNCDALCCGFQEAVLHHHPLSLYARDNLEMIFDARLSEVVESLAQSLGLSAAATCQELDARQAWFVCNSCYSDPTVSNAGHKLAMTWRQCLHHSYRTHMAPSGPPSFTLLSHEGHRTLDWPDPRNTVPGWFCNHCSQYVGTRADFASFGDINLCNVKVVVVQHIKTTHGIEVPAVDQDLFWHPGQSNNHAVTRPLVRQTSGTNASADTVAKYRCSHCPLQNREFQFNGVKDHIKMKHNIPNAVAGRDYYASES